MRDRRWIAGLTLAAIAIASWFWLGRQTHRPAAEQAAAERLPDSYFEEMNVVSHNSEGEAVSSLQAARALHYPDDDIVYLTGVKARSLNPEDNWALQSNAGRLWPDANRLLATDKAVLTQTGSEGAPVSIESNSLLLDSENETVTTDDPVTISQGRSAISGVGLSASMRDDHIVIHSSVEARYADDQ